MRAIIALLVVVLLMGLAGWITFGSSPGRTSINIETDEIQRDTENAVESTERAIKSGARAITGHDKHEVEQPPSEPYVVYPTLDQPVPIDSEPITTSPTQTPATSPTVNP